MSLSINVSDSITPALDRLKAGLADRTGLHQAILGEELALVKRHLTNVSLRRRNKFGAPSSGFWGRAVESTTGSADSSAATVSIRHPGIGRAVRDITIKPGPGKKYLTIPLAREAYNRRLRGQRNIFFLRTRGGGLVAGRPSAGPGSDMVALYLLVTEVHQKKDPTLLPPDEAFTQAAVVAADRYVTATIEARRVT